jgi:hypothetical protein
MSYRFSFELSGSPAFTAEDALSLSPREGVKKSVSSGFYAQQGVDRFPNLTIAKS